MGQVRYGGGLQGPFMALTSFPNAPSEGLSGESFGHRRAQLPLSKSVAFNALAILSLEHVQVAARDQRWQQSCAVEALSERDWPSGALLLCGA